MKQDFWEFLQRLRYKDRADALWINAVNRGQCHCAIRSVTLKSSEAVVRADRDRWRDDEFGYFRVHEKALTCT